MILKIIEKSAQLHFAMEYKKQPLKSASNVNSNDMKLLSENDESY